jgi:hypothetical protein
MSFGRQVLIEADWPATAKVWLKFANHASRPISGKQIEAWNYTD